MKNKNVASVYFCIAIIAVASFSLSCKKESTEPDFFMGYEYFPVNVGHYVIYDVDSIYHDGFTGLSDTVHFKVKEMVESTYNDIQGRPTQRLERYRKDNDTTDWYLRDVWCFNLTSSTAEKTEENVRYVKLVFALEKSKKWNGNAYNIFGEQVYKFLDVNNEYDLNGMTYDSTVTVLQKEEYTLISSDYQVEVFAKNIGLIYKEFIQLETEISGTIKSGVEYKYTIESWGN